MDSPNQRDQDVLTFIREYIIKVGWPPSSRDIAQAFPNPNSGRPASTNTIHSWLEKLVRLGWIEKEPRVSRGIRITKIEKEELPERTSS